MTTSTNKKGLRKHINQIINLASWEGVDLTLKKRTIETDPNGKFIGESHNNISLTGVISRGSFKNADAVGKVQDREVKCLLVWPEDGDVSQIPVVDQDWIIENFTGDEHTYLVKEIPNIDYDIDDPVLITVVLQEAPNAT